MPTIIQALKFAQGAIRKNNVMPELEHYQIKNGKVVGYNGFIALSSPIDLDFSALPKADLFYRAIEASDTAVALSLTKSGRVLIQSGKFKAFVPCIEKPVHEVAPSGESYPAPPKLVASFRRMLPFISEDAARPWAMGLLVSHGAYTATNNIVILQLWDGHKLPTFNCPRFVVQEICRIGEQPDRVQFNGSSVTFHYQDGRWLHSQLLADQWPEETMNRILNATSAPVEVPRELFEATKKMAPFAADGWSAVYFRDGGVGTSRSFEDQDGVFIDVEGIPDGPIFSLRALNMIAPECTKIDFSLYPAPCIFYGENSRGAIVGMNA